MPNKFTDTREEAMEITRRHLAAAGALALGTLSLSQSPSLAAEFVDGVMMSKAVTKSIAFPELTVAVVGDIAIARHLYESEMETDGKTNNVKIGALQVWQKQNGN